MVEAVQRKKGGGDQQGKKSADKKKILLQGRFNPKLTDKNSAVSHKLLG